MRVLVTGGSGFIGSRLVSGLIQQRHEVFCIRRHDSVSPGAGTDIFWDLASRETPRGLPDRIDAVAHLAQARRYRQFPDDAPEMFRVNVAGTAALLEYGREAGASAFCLVSSGTVYEPYTGEISEDAPVAPTGYLGASKFAAEVVSRPYADLFALSILRLFFPYGPGQRERLVPDLIERVCKGLPIRLSGDGEGLRLVPTFVDDIVDVIIAALAGSWRGTFNVASPVVLSIREMAELIGETIGKRPRFEVTHERAGIIVPQLERLGARLDLHRLTPPEEGIRRTIAAQT
jgi:nucleoside-diphosphate-sugar epimerase